MLVITFNVVMRGSKSDASPCVPSPSMHALLPGPVLLGLRPVMPCMNRMVMYQFGVCFPDIGSSILCYQRQIAKESYVLLGWGAWFLIVYVICRGGVVGFSIDVVVGLPWAANEAHGQRSSVVG